MNSKLFGWEFYVYHTTDVAPQISVEEIQPFDLYAHDIKKTFFKPFSVKPPFLFKAYPILPQIEFAVNGFTFAKIYGRINL